MYKNILIALLIITIESNGEPIIINNRDDLNTKYGIDSVEAEKIIEKFKDRIPQIGYVNVYEKMKPEEKSIYKPLWEKLDPNSKGSNSWDSQHTIKMNPSVNDANLITIFVVPSMLPLCKIQRNVLYEELKKKDIQPPVADKQTTHQVGPRTQQIPLQNPIQTALASKAVIQIDLPQQFKSNTLYRDFREIVQNMQRTRSNDQNIENMNGHSEVFYQFLQHQLETRQVGMSAQKQSISQYQVGMREEGAYHILYFLSDGVRTDILRVRSEIVKLGYNAPITGPPEIERKRSDKKADEIFPDVKNLFERHNLEDTTIQIQRNYQLRFDSELKNDLQDQLKSNDIPPMVITGLKQIVDDVIRMNFNPDETDKTHLYRIGYDLMVREKQLEIPMQSTIDPLVAIYNYCVDFIRRYVPGYELYQGELFVVEVDAAADWVSLNIVSGRKYHTVLQVERELLTSAPIVFGEWWKPQRRRMTAKTTLDDWRYLR